MSYKQKYIKYKKKYCDIKRKKKNENYYLLHGTDLPHFDKILESGFIFSGKYLPDEEIRQRGWEKLPYVYCHIYYDDIKNLPFAHGYSFIIDPMIILDKGMIFNKGWHVHPNKDSIIIKVNDSNFDNKMNEIRELLINPTYVPEILRKLRGPYRFMDHEILIKDSIDLHKYLIAVIIPNIVNIDTYEQELNEKGYKNVKIFTTSTLPDIKDLC